MFEDWEADIGRTYVLGRHPGRKLVADLPNVFDRVQRHYHSAPEITGAELYAFAQTAAADAGCAGWASAMPADDATPRIANAMADSMRLRAAKPLWSVPLDFKMDFPLVPESGRAPSRPT